MKKSQSVDSTTYFVVVRTKTYASLVLTRPESISDKKKKGGEKATIALQNRFSGHRNYLSAYIPVWRAAMFPWDLCANARIRLLADHVRTPIALHCGSPIFNMAVNSLGSKGDRNRQILTEQSVNVRPFFLPFTIAKYNFTYSEFVQVFFVCVCRVFYRSQGQTQALFFSM